MAHRLLLDELILRSLAKKEAHVSRDMEEALKLVRARYLARLPEQMRLLRELLSEPETTQKRGDAARLAHRLKGSSASYGLVGLSKALGQLEEMLRRNAYVPLIELQGVLSGCILSANLEGALDRTVNLRSELRVEPEIRHPAGRVLLVELDPRLAARCAELLRHDSVEVVVCERVEDAERLSHGGWVEFALLQTSPEHDVVERVERLRRAAGNMWLPIGTFSGEPNVRKHREAAAAGVDFFLSSNAPDAPLQEAFDQLRERSNQIAPKVLMVDDDVDLLNSLEVVLAANGMRTQQLHDPARLFDVLDSWDPDLLTLDVEMPDLGGPEICSILRSSTRWQALPIIMVTGREDRETRLSCYRAGCDDYMVKPFDPEEIVVRIQARVARKRILLRSERDPLSGLILRRPLSIRSHMRMSEARRHKVPLSVCMLDLDRFKALNDRHGHAAGDRVISTLGRLLRSRLREEDLAGRWGGEEFVVTLPHTNGPAAIALTTDVLSQLALVDFRDDTGATFRATFSAGIATYPVDADSFERLLQIADQRLYAAKRAGRARVSSAETAFSPSVR